MNKKYWIFITVGVIITILAPSLLSLPAICSFFSFDESCAAVGDTIGGITAPFVGIISVVLLCWTLNLQIKSSRNQASDNTIQQLLSLQNNLFSFDGMLKIRFTVDNYTKVPEPCRGVNELLVLVSTGPTYVPRITISEAKKLIYSLNVMTDICDTIIRVSRGVDNLDLRKNFVNTSKDYLKRFQEVLNWIENRSIKLLSSMSEMSNSDDTEFDEPYILRLANNQRKRIDGMIQRIDEVKWNYQETS